MSDDERKQPLDARAHCGDGDGAQRELTSDEARDAFDQAFARIYGKGARVEVGVDLAAAGGDRMLYVCTCGYASSSAATFLDHVEEHHQS